MRIGDFGLARALAEAAWTEPAGAMLGTARYACPEQARGEPADGKGDVYSLALVLIEAVTGRVPFAADTTIATLMARVDKPVEVPARAGPVAGRARARRTARPGRAARRRRVRALRLLAASEKLDRPDPLPLVGATAGASDITIVDQYPTQLPPMATGEPAFATGAAPPPPPATKARSRRRWPLIVGAIAVVLALTAGAAFAWNNAACREPQGAATRRLDGGTSNERDRGESLAGTPPRRA